MFGIRLKELRTKYGYTQETLGEKLGVSDKTIGAWERGTREPPMKSIKFWLTSLMFLLIT